MSAGLAHKGTGCLKARYQAVDLLPGVVEVEAGPAGGRHPELAHEGLGAVVSRPNGNALIVQNLGHIVGVYALNVKGQHRAAGGPVAVEGHTREG